MNTMQIQLLLQSIQQMICKGDHEWEAANCSEGHRGVFKRLYWQSLKPESFPELEIV
jgi:hypothetical protein